MGWRFRRLGFLSVVVVLAALALAACEAMSEAAARPRLRRHPGEQLHGDRQRSARIRQGGRWARIRGLTKWRAVALAVVVALLAAAPSAQADGDYVRKYSRAAAVIAGWDVPVYCWAEVENWNRLFPPNAAGVYLRVRGEIHLHPLRCLALAKALVNGLRPAGIAGKVDLAHGLQTLAHEAWHAAGVFNEKQADCYGMQEIETMSAKLGLGRQYGQNLGRLFWKNFYNRPGYLYWSPKCRDDGRWDLYRGSVWP